MLSAAHLDSSLRKLVQDDNNPDFENNRRAKNAGVE